MEVEKARPPYVTFETRAIENRNASIEAGHYVTKDVNFVIITPQGSKDRIERIADEWFVKLTDDVRSGRFEQAWLTAYKEAYKAWKEGKEIPENGSAILNWPVLSPSQTQALIACNLRTIEDVATANEEAIAKIGMGGRALKQKAIDWLAAAKGLGKTTEELSSLKVANQGLETQNKQLLEAVADLQKRLTALESPKNAAAKG